MNEGTRKALELAREALQRGSVIKDTMAIAAIDAALKEPAAPVAHPVIGPEWQACVKLPITVHVREQRPGEARVSTREGITPVRPDDLIMRGVAGEEYPIGRELFDRTYRLGDAPAAPVAAQCTNADKWNCKYCRKTEECKAINDPRNFGKAAPAAPVAQPVSGITALQAELWKLAVRKGLVTVHTERVSPTDQRTKVSWLEGHAKACDVSNDAAHGITKGEA